MSDFMDMMVDMLPINSNIQKPQNPFRKVLDGSVGEYMDGISNIFDELFLDTATGGWLDAHGRDYGVLRNAGESDESYRERIIFEKLEYLNAHNLQNIYGFVLYSYVEDYSPDENTLTSDNPYNSNHYMAYASEELQGILERKFILGDGITWL